MKTLRAYLRQPRHFELVEEDLYPNDDQILVKMQLCGLCNWELNFWQGTGEPDGYYNTYPWVLGHEWAGTVVETGKNVTKFKAGDKVTYLPGDAFGGFSQYSLFTEGDLYKLEDNVSLYNAMGEPLKCILTVLRNAAPAPGDTGLVFGCGPMGLWCTQALKSNTLGQLIAVDVDDAKLELAKKYGATHTVNPLKEDAPSRISEITGGRFCDFVIEGTGNAKLIPNVVPFLAERGRLVLMSSYSTNIPDFNISAIMDKGAKVFTAHPVSSPDVLDDMRRAVALINRGTFHNEDLLSHRFKLEEINMAFETLEHKPKDYIKGIIEF